MTHQQEIDDEFEVGETVLVMYANMGMMTTKEEVVKSITKSYIRTDNGRYGLKSHRGLGIISGGGSLTSLMCKIKGGWG